MRTATLALVFAGSLFGQGYTVSTFAGGGLPVNIAAPSAAIGPIVSVATDSSGNLYFPSGNAVLRMDAGTRILTLVAGNGTQGFSGDGGPATAAQLYQPNAVAVDSAGNLYIADANRIREVSNGIIATIAGNGTAGAAGDNGPAISAEVAPLSLAVDSAGNLYLANSVGGTLLPGGPFGGGPFVSSDSIRKISHGTIVTVAGNGTCCNPSADNVPATSTPLYDLSGIVVDSAGNLYAASGADPDNAAAVRKISNGIVTTVAGGASATGNSSTYSGPANNAEMGALGGLALDSAGNLYVADHTYNGVREISNGTIATVAGYGPTGYGGDGGPATGARLNLPRGIAVDSAGNLYIADWINNAIREVSGGIISTAAGNGQISFSGDNGPATSAQLLIPAGLALDSAGNLYIADQDNSRIREVSNGIVTIVAGSSAQGFSGDGGPATAAGLYVPEGVAVDSAGNLYIADTANSCVRKVSNGVITTIAGRGSGANGFGDGGPATAAFFASVVAVAVDSAGNVYVSDQVAARVRKIANGIVTTVAGNGHDGFSGDNGPAASAELSDPRDLAVDSQGNLYINDQGNLRIREVANGAITTVAGTDSGRSSGDGGPATSAGILPAGLALDSAGNLYISDSGSIRKVSGGIIHTIAGTGTAGYSGENLPALSAQMSPGPLAVDSAGNIYFSESGANRVRVLRPQAAACTTNIAQTNLIVGYTGGTLTLNVVTAASCVWAVQGLPSWITHSGSGGIGPATITVAVAPDPGAPRSATFTIANTAFTVTQEPPLTIATLSPLPAGTTGAAYSQALAASGGTPPYAWTLASGTLPPGVTLSGSGTIAGTPSAAGVFNLTVAVTDTASAVASLTYALTVIAPGGATPPGSIVTHTLPTSALGVFIDAAGNVYTAAQTLGPATVTPGAAQSQSNGAPDCGPNNASACPNAYIAKADANGKLLVATFLGGPNSASANAITADAAGNMYLVGVATGLPVTAHAAIPTEPPGAEGYAAKLSADGTKFLYVTYLPAQLVPDRASVAVDAAGNLYIGGFTNNLQPNNQPIVVALSADGSSILYAKVLASQGAVGALTVDPDGNVVAAGVSAATDLPVTPGALQTALASLAGSSNGFVAKLDPSGEVLAATYFGGSVSTAIYGVQTDSAGNIYVAGTTESLNFPTTAGSLWPAPPIPLWSNGEQFGFVAKMTPNAASLLYSTYMPTYMTLAWTS